MRTKMAAAFGAVGGTTGAALAGLAAWRLGRMVRRIAALERLAPSAPAWATYPMVVKPTPVEVFAPKGTGTDFETRPSMFGEGIVVPSDRFYLRSHSPTPRIDADRWRLRIGGDGVQRPVEFSYDQLNAMPQTTITRTLECAGNGRRLFMEAFGIEAQGGQWGLGAIGTAEWSGVRLGDLLAHAELLETARDVMPIGLDEHEVSRPLPLAKALEQGTLVALRMNGEPLLADHGFPARMVVPGWVGTAWIKWVGQIQVSTTALHSPYNTAEYVLIGPHYRTGNPELGPVITDMPVISLLELDRPAVLDPAPRTIYGRAYAGEATVREVAYRIDDGPWRPTRLDGPTEPALWTRFSFDWTPTPGSHEIRLRASDDRGRSQPDTVPWNHHGYLYNAVTAHPITVAGR